MEKLNYLVYSSVRNANCTDEEIQKILKSCEKNNPGKSVTGVLVHSKNYFLQFLEGAENDLTSLFNLIKKDDRHSKVILLNKGEITERMFPAWHMGYKDADKEDLKLITDATIEENEVFNKLIKGGIIEDSKVLKMLSRFYKLV
jgi:hypothetical protein